MEGKNDSRMNHPHFAHLLKLWRDMKSRASGIAPEWKNFWNFFEWAVDNQWEPGSVIRRLDKSMPKGPENCRIDFGERKPINLAEIKVRGGSENSPCHFCHNEDAGNCTKYKSCLQYRAWLQHSWEDFRKAALAQFGKTTID